MMLCIFFEKGDRAEFGTQSTFSTYTLPKKAAQAAFNGCKFRFLFSPSAETPAEGFLGSLMRPRFS